MPSQSFSRVPSISRDDETSDPVSSTQQPYIVKNDTTKNRNESVFELQTLVSPKMPGRSSVYDSSPMLEKTSRSPMHVNWGSYRVQPTLMTLYAFAGIILALAHHFYYMYLHGKEPGSAMRQQWATAFGTAFSFLVIALFRTAIGHAYNQYVWTLVKRRSYSIGGLDKLFAMTSNPLGFLSWELLKQAKIGLTLALAVWFVKS
jgi:hypothetical protein